MIPPPPQNFSTPRCATDAVSHRSGRQKWLNGLWSLQWVSLNLCCQVGGVAWLCDRRGRVWGRHSAVLRLFTSRAAYPNCSWVHVSCNEEVGRGERTGVECSHVITQTHSLLCREEIICQNPKNYQHVVQKSIIGASVLTRYNNRMYRIDDIDWNKSPKSTFATHDGEVVSIMTSICADPVEYLDYGSAMWWSRRVSVIILPNWYQTAFYVCCFHSTRFHIARMFLISVRVLSLSFAVSHFWFWAKARVFFVSISGRMQGNL
jgi:hypothetical protein